MSKKSSIDRISGLPEELLLHILSFVTTRQAVWMSLLSKRWRHLWTCIPVLYFDSIEFHRLQRDKPTAFYDFIDQVLFLRREDESIRKFHFKAFNHVDGSHVTQWVIDVARHTNVEELVIYIHGIQENTVAELSHCLVSCQSLRVLKLDITFGGGIFKLPNDLNLSGLKSLHLKGITSEGDSLEKLISNCHFLEDLYLRHCRFDNLILSGNNLKKLSISFCNQSKIKVSAPNLVSFVYHPGIRQHCSIDNLVSLVDAHIHIVNPKALFKGMITICEILQGIRNASSLTIIYSHYKHLCLQQELVECVPTFSNLTRLELSIWLNKGHVETIINVLERSPNLKTLILNKQKPSVSPMPKQEEDSSWIPRNVSPLFLPHLSQIEINYFKSSALQLEFVKFLLGNTRSVREITIIPYVQ